MLGKTALILISAAILSTGVVRAADVPAATTQTLTALYQLSCAAALDPTDKNLDAAFAVLAPDFTSTDLKGKITKRDDFIGQGKQQLKTYHVTACTNSLDSVTAGDANSVVIVSGSHNVGDVQAPDGKHDFDAVSKSQDTWKLTDGKWQIAQTKDLRNLVKVDGSVVVDQGQ